MKNVTLGNITVSRVIEFEGPFVQPQQLLPDATTEAVEAHRHWLAPHFMDPTGTFIMSVHTYQVRYATNRSE